MLVRFSCTKGLRATDIHQLNASFVYGEVFFASSFKDHIGDKYFVDDTDVENERELFSYNYRDIKSVLFAFKKQKLELYFIFYYICGDNDHFDFVQSTVYYMFAWKLEISLFLRHITSFKCLFLILKSSNWFADGSNTRILIIHYFSHQNFTFQTYCYVFIFKGCF